MRVRLLLTGVLGLVCMCAVLVLGAGSAFGVVVYPFDGELAPSGGGFGGLEASSVAVDDANGDTYVAASSAGVVYVFETATGTQLANLDASLTPAGSFGGGQVQVAANNGSGVVYVLDSTDNVVDVFNSLGGYTGQFGGPSGGFSDPGGIAVDQASGDVYIVDAHHAVVDVFSATGVYLRQLSLASVPTGFSALSETYTRSVAVNRFNGDVLVADSGTDTVYEFNAAGTYVATWTGASTPAGSFGGGYVSVAADDTSGEVYVTDSTHAVTDVFDSAGQYLTQFSDSAPEAKGTAVDQASAKIYVSQGTVVDIIGPPTVLPDLSTGTASNEQPTSVTLNGSVNPRGVALTSCVFEYGADTSYGQSAPCVPAAGSIAADSSEHAVSAQISGLEEGASYHFRLVAGNANGAIQGSDARFTMPSAPTIDSATAANLTPDSADLRAVINPHSADTTYRFEYGTSTSYGTTVPIPDGHIPASLLGQTVIQHITGLQENTTYHWRLLAQNDAGSVTGGDHTFIYTSGGATGLPDGRAYEIVTPPAKNAALIGDVLLGLAPDIAGDGSHVIMSSIQCFGNATSCPADNSKVGTPFEFTRTNDGWTAAGLAPPATQLDNNNGEGVSADAGTGLFLAPAPPVGEEDWYARRPDGSFVDIGPTSPPAEGLIGRRIGLNGLSARATADLSYLVYESRPLWPFDATIDPNSSLYEFVGAGNSAPMLVGVSGGMGSTDLISKCGTELGSGGQVNGGPGAISGDGRTVFFAVSACASGAGVNAGVEVPTKELFARIDESRSVPISQPSPLECTAGNGCLGSPPGPADFVAASNDGSKAFFLDTQQLTDNASEDSSHSGGAARCNGLSVETIDCNLYEYDFSRSTGHNLVAVSAGDSSGGGPRVQGVVGMSADGSHIYFIARGVLTAAANERGQTARDGADNLYGFEQDAAYPNGRVSFIATLPEADDFIATQYATWTGGLLSDDVTPDGRFLVFESHARLTVDDTSSTGAAQVFRYDSRTGDLVRISVGENGFNDNGNAGVADAMIVTPKQSLGPKRSDPTMSHDGSYVFFESPVGLTPGALNDVPLGGNEPSTGEPAYGENVYEWHNGHVYLLSDGRDVSGSGAASCGFHLSSTCLFGADATGSNVFFSTADHLVSADTDTEEDVYDARVCTTREPCLASPASPVAPCQGDACHGTPPPAPGVVAAATVTFSGPGNLASSTASVVKAKAKRHKARAKKPKRRRRRLGRHTRSGRRGHGHSSRAGGR
jgi:DNA-binding beta-propeller fold protein YncE